MFSGLVREIAEVKQFSLNTLEILTHYAPKAQIGDSIAINGACLTVIKTTQHSLSMQLSEETKRAVALENYQKGQKVHLEPALKLGDKLDGHIVQGHIDGISEILHIHHSTYQSDFYLHLPPQMRVLLVPKGSICVEGISLTIVECNDNAFKLTLIPHTMQNTLFGTFRVGRRVNIESDIFTRTIVSALHNMRDSHLQDSHLNKNKPSKATSWADIDRILMRF